MAAADVSAPPALILALRKSHNLGESMHVLCHCRDPSTLTIGQPIPASVLNQSTYETWVVYAFRLTWGQPRYC